MKNLRKWINVLYASGLVVWIFRLSADDLQKKLSIFSISAAHRSGKFTMPFTKIGGGGLIGLIWFGVSEVRFCVSVVEFCVIWVSACNSSYWFLVINNFLFLFILGSGEHRSDESDKFLLLDLCAHLPF